MFQSPKQSCLSMIAGGKRHNLDPARLKFRNLVRQRLDKIFPAVMTDGHRLAFLQRELENQVELGLDVLDVVLVIQESFVRQARYSQALGHLANHGMSGGARVEK